LFFQAKLALSVATAGQNNPDRDQEGGTRGEEARIEIHHVLFIVDSELPNKASAAKMTAPMVIPESATLKAGQ
jgi:hypothetical protein